MYSIIKHILSYHIPVIAVQQLLQILNLLLYLFTDIRISDHNTICFRFHSKRRGFNILIIIQCLMNALKRLMLLKAQSV